MGGQDKDFPDFLHPSDGLLAGAKAPTPLALETAHAAGQMHQQQPIFFKARGAFFRGKAQALDRAGDVVCQ